MCKLDEIILECKKKQNINLYQRVESAEATGYGLGSTAAPGTDLGSSRPASWARSYISLSILSLSLLFPPPCFSFKKEKPLENDFSLFSCLLDFVNQNECERDSDEVKYKHKVKLRCVI